MGAGLGGGSSDGAFTLTLLNRFFELGLSDDRLLEFAGQLGSDCAFFIRNQPAVGTEKGNVLTNVWLSLSGKFLVLVKPDVFVGTAEAYAGVIPQKPQHSLPELLKQPISEWRHQVNNDFENSIFPKHPEIQVVKEQLYQQGAAYASMTGSGSAVFGIFEEEKQLKTLFPGMFYWGGWLK
jgi:4-diphosphocytidyl-2-C-methyl-D-erythritol kinase